ncbi:MAG: metallophosphoesterase [Cytophagaceae bacterium]|jgi:5'-nucleotidase|nr:metallophosphoesterase [Cytophagaceae bacterium]
MQNRRNFIKTIIGGSALAALPASAYTFWGRETQKLVILHTNDTHSRIDPIPNDGSQYAGMGGVARRMTLIDKIRREHEHVLLLDSGDIFQGTPYFNFYDGKLELQLMTRMKYDASTLGNHEFDNGIDNLSHQLQYAGFPFINTNYDVSETALNGKLKRSHIIQKGNLRIGLIGLGINPKGLIADSNYKGMLYNAPVQTGDLEAKMLKEKEHCHLVIALSHLGLKMDAIDDLKVAAQTRHIDLIIGGHTHTFMETPEMVTNLNGNPVVIQQAGTAGICLGRLDVVFEQGEAKTTSRIYEVK